MSSRALLSYVSPEQFILLSFSLFLCLGAILLALPISTVQPVPLLDIIFTATTSLCATGLFTVPLEIFSRFGQFVIMLLMQIGALGLSTIWLSIVYMFRDPGLTTKVFAMQILEVEERPLIKQLLRFTVGTTLFIELIGFLILFPLFYSRYSLFDAAFLTLFHVISAFCNAGISYEPDPKAQHLADFGSNFLFLFTTTALVFLGGFGFITVQEIILYVKERFRGKYHIFTLTTKIVIFMSLIQPFLCGFIFWLIEHNHALSAFSTPMQLAQTLFHVISFKSCGFTTISVDLLQPATLFFALIIGFIGSAPGSTGGGVRLTTFLLYCSAIRAATLGRDSVNIARREIASGQIFKAIAIVNISVFWIGTILFFLLIFEQWNFFELLFEVVNATTNLGISLKGTDNLSLIGKILIMISMIIGRVGSLTFIASLKNRHRRSRVGFSYPQEHIMLG